MTGRVELLIYWRVFPSENALNAAEPMMERTRESRRFLGRTSPWGFNQQNKNVALTNIGTSRELKNNHPNLTIINIFIYAYINMFNRHSPTQTIKQTHL